MDNANNFRSREILLKDKQAASGKQPPFTYRAGQEFHFVAEVLPYWSDLAEDVVPIKGGPVPGFEFSQGGKPFAVLHNEPESAVEHELKVFGGSAHVFSPPRRGNSPPLGNDQALFRYLH